MHIPTLYAHVHLDHLITGDQVLILPINLDGDRLAAGTILDVHM